MKKQMFLIWSWEHRAWWRENGHGYTPDVDDAGEYSYKEAIKICLGANFGFNRGSGGSLGMPNEGMVPVENV